MNYLKKIRVVLAIICLIIITALFLDFTSTIHNYLDWMARVQLIPSILALNAVVIIGLTLFTLLFGRVYCSIICPLGVFQDVVSKFNKKRNKYSYSPAKKWLRYGATTLFIVAIIAGIGSVVVVLEPYSAYGRIVSNLFAPIYNMANNLLAYIAERANNYAFYSTEIWIKSATAFCISLATLIFITALSWRGGRSYCNTICPVGTILGILSEFSLFKHRIDREKCNKCGLCSKNCKASCIDSERQAIDYSRCVSCFNCIDKCKMGAISYCLSHKKKEEQPDSVRRNLLTLVGTLFATSIVKAQEKKVDGGLAFIEDKKIPQRQTAIVPPGSKSIRNFTTHCTGCQLCVTVCENQVLRPSSDLSTFMQPEVSYEKGYCRPECTKCSEVCPSGAILKMSPADKSATQIGHAVWIEKNCVVLTDNVECGNCARHCPTNAITMVEKRIDNINSQKIPIVNTEKCIGCGACENLCPARPFSAIYVEGHTMHRNI